MTSAPSAPARRNLSLDVLRAAAVFLVLGRHTGPPPDDLEPVLKAVILAWQRGGWAGVDLFFVLSGFLISGLLFVDYQKNGRMGIGRFYTRRAFKIIPPLYVLVFVTFVLRTWNRSSPPWPGTLAELLFVQNYFPGLWGHTWSLAVEEHFYLTMPVLLWAAVRTAGAVRDPFRLPVLAGGTAVVLLLPGVRAWNASGKDYDFAFVNSTHLRVDALTAGVMLSYVYHFAGRTWAALRPARWPLIGCGLGLLAPAFAWQVETTPFVYTLGFTANALAGVALLAGLSHTGVRPNRAGRAMGYVGIHSYSIYLWHVSVGTWFLPQLTARVGGGLPPPLHFAVFDFTAYVALSIGLGVIAAKLVEAPAVRLRDALFPPRSGALQTVPPADAAGVEAKKVDA